MKKIDIRQIKELRARTGVSIADCKAALEKANGDMDKALQILKKRGLEIAAKKATRPTGSGIVESYIHHTKNSGATVVIGSETDFVARNPEFKKLAHDIAAQVTATDPKELSELLAQPWIRDESKTIGDLLNQNIASFGENIRIEDFKRFEVGQKK